jgi:hypothetical protein
LVAFLVSTSGKYEAKKQTREFVTMSLLVLRSLVSMPFCLPLSLLKFLFVLFCFVLLAFELSFVFAKRALYCLKHASRP